MARVTPAKRATRASTKKPAGGHEDWMDDEVDEHHRSRDKISLDPDASSSEDDEDDEDVAGVMDIAAEDDSEDETSDDDETDDEEDEGEEEEGKKNTATDPGDSDGDEEEAALIRAMRAQQRRLDAKGATRRTADDDDLEDSETDSDDETAGIRGSKKDDFYGDDDVDHEGLSDEDDRIDEEREARRLQRAAADGMQGGDFDAFSDSESESEEEKTMGAKAKLVANKGKKGAAKKTKASTKKSEGAFVESLGAEAVAHAASDAVVGDAPELIALTKELTKNLDEVRNSVEPVIAAARAGDLVTAEGISYLDAKHLLMLSYCVNIVFYLLLKSEGRPVKDHPVVLRLVEIRAYLEKLRPIDRKLKYQVDKLLKMAEGKQQNTNDGSDEDDDPTKHKPNPDALVGAGGDGTYFISQIPPPRLPIQD
jgi:U3 small nucleolar RNA-associated protein 3|tara:strand:- start:447 stop:1718 length:1272 start_codon:yes stop_codon:yes gene_type:complete